MVSITAHIGVKCFRFLRPSVDHGLSTRGRHPLLIPMRPPLTPGRWYAHHEHRHIIVQEIKASEPVILRQDGRHSLDVIEADRAEDTSDMAIVYETLEREDGQPGMCADVLDPQPVPRLTIVMHDAGPGALVGVRHERVPGPVAVNAEGFAVWRGLQVVVSVPLEVMARHGCTYNLARTF